MYSLKWDRGKPLTRSSLQICDMYFHRWTREHVVRVGLFVESRERGCIFCPRKATNRAESQKRDFVVGWGDPGGLEKCDILERVSNTWTLRVEVIHHCNGAIQTVERGN